LLKFRALPLLLTPPNALPRETAGWAERLKAGLASFGDGLGRLIVGVRAADRVAGVAWELQPRDSRLRAEAKAPGEPLVRKRLWSGCHFCGVRLTLLIVLWLMFTLRLMSMSTSPWW
jgi:hypothetical protein